VGAGEEAGIKFRKQLISVETLKGFTAAQWADWFRDGIGQWLESGPIVVRDISTLSPEDFQRRLRAFNPLKIRANELNPANAILAQIREIKEGTIAEPAKGIGIALDGAQVAIDGAQAVAFTIRIATSLGTIKLTPRILKVIDRPMYCSSSERDELLNAILGATYNRATRRETLHMAQELGAKGWLTPHAASRLLPAIARGSGTRLARHIAELYPEVASKGASREALEELAAEMAKTSIWSLPRPRRSGGAMGKYEAACSLIAELVGQMKNSPNNRLDELRPQIFQNFRSILDKDSHRRRSTIH